MTKSHHAATRFLRLVAVAAGTCLLAHSAWAQSSWPNKPIRLLVGFPPGGTVDVMARIVAEQLSPLLGQPVVVENKPGASGNMAASNVVSSTPDGYTLLVSSTSVETANPSLFKTNFQMSEDLVAINTVGRAAIYLVGKPDLKANDVKDLIALAKSQPQALSYGSAGTGTQLHLAGEIFKQSAGFQASHIPYRGAAPAIQDVMGGQIDFVLDPGIALPYINGGKVKLLGVLSSKRSPFFPQVPTLAEQGVPGAELDIWFGMWAPKNTPKDVIARLQKELPRAMEAAIVRERYAMVGAEPSVIGEAAFRKLLTSEREVFSRIIKERGITAE